MNRLQERRLELGLTQPQVSAELKEVEARIDVSMVSRYEKGVCLPTVAQLEQLESTLQAPRTELFDLEELDLLGTLRPQQEPLTPREIEVLTLIVRGFLNKQIAQQLHVALTTVISHRRNLIRKLGIRSVAGLTIYAVTKGYVDAEQLCDN